MRFIFLFLFLFSSIALGIDGKATFEAGTFDKMISFNGHGAKVSGGEFVGGKLQGIFVCDMKGFKTDDEDRDHDMQEKIFNSKKFPTAWLDMEPSSGPTFKGVLTFQGIKKPVNGKLKIKGKKAEASFVVKFTDFGIAVPTLLGVRPDETVNLDIELDL